MLDPGNMRSQGDLNLRHIPILQRRHDRSMFVLRFTRIAVGNIVDTRSMSVGVELCVCAEQAIIAGSLDQSRMKLLIIDAEHFVIAKAVTLDRLLHIYHRRVQYGQKMPNLLLLKNDFSRV